MRRGGNEAGCLRNPSQRYLSNRGSSATYVRCHHSTATNGLRCRGNAIHAPLGGRPGTPPHASPEKQASRTPLERAHGRSPAFACDVEAVAHATGTHVNALPPRQRTSHPPRTLATRGSASSRAHDAAPARPRVQAPSHAPRSASPFPRPVRAAKRVPGSTSSDAIGDARWLAVHVLGADRPTAADLVRARRFLHRLDAKHGGALLADGRGLTFHLATLAELEPDLVRDLDTPEARLDELEAQARTRGAQVAALEQAGARVAAQIAANARELVRQAALAERARRATSHASAVVGGRAPLAGPVEGGTGGRAPIQPRPSRRSDER